MQVRKGSTSMEVFKRLYAKAILEDRDGFFFNGKHFDMELAKFTIDTFESRQKMSELDEPIKL